MAPTSALIAPSPPALQQATKTSTTTWQNDLQALFHHAKDRFPDVVWELPLDAQEHGRSVEEVWGHKAIVYARAPPSFQARYFSFRPAPSPSPLPYASSPLPAHSTASLASAHDLGISRSPSPYRSSSPAPSNLPGTLLRLNTSINPILFSNELEYLYTGKGFGEAFEFLFDTTESREEGDAEESRIDKLRKDLVFMWRSRLYSDVRISLTGNFSSSSHDDTTAIFSSHRFILVSRSPYFHNALLSWGVAPPKTGEPITITLPSPPFTPASLHFTLGFIYTGTLIFSHRSYDLDTAFHIMRSSTYLSLDALYDEIQARIVQEMMHGLFHAFLSFEEYERMTGSKWGTGGCRCRQCARRAPRVLEFALGEDVKNRYLERGARRALVGLFGEGWCTSEFAGLPQKTRTGLLAGLAKRTQPNNIFPLLFAAQHAVVKLGNVIDAWADISRDAVLAARKNIDEVLCSSAEECFEQPEWLELLEADGVRFEDGERVESVMDSVKRGLNEKNAGMVYQVIVSSILLRPHATETDETMLSSTSHIRVQVEDTRMEVLRWLRKRWIGVRNESGFDSLEGWAIKEISGEIEVPVEDLFNPNPTVVNGSAPRNSLKPNVIKYDQESDTISMQSLRTSVLNKTTNNKPRTTPTPNPVLPSSSSVTSSIRSPARSTFSTASRANATTPTGRRVSKPPPGPRPDSKLTPSNSSVHMSIREDDDDIDEDSETQSSVASTTRTATSPGFSTPRSQLRPLSKSPTSTAGVRKSVVSRVSTAGDRPRSSASSFVSVKSHASTIRSSGVAAGPSKRSGPRPDSTLSTNTNASTFKTASEARSVSKKVSASSTLSTASTKSVNVSSTPRSRVNSAASTTSTTPTTSAKRPPVLVRDPSKLSPAMANRASSVASSRSSMASLKTAPSRKSVADKEQQPVEPPPIPINLPGQTLSPASALKGKNRADTASEVDKRASTISATSTVNGKLKRKGSTDTITRTSVASQHVSVTNKAPSSVAGSQKPQSVLRGQISNVPRGAMLEIGIPCIISSKRKRFKAFARYIGEVEGESGPWVGVEVPLGETWAGEKLEGRAWHDGSWGGIRYFEIGGSGSDWEYGDDRATRRRRVDYAGTERKGLKREGDQLHVDRAKRFRTASPAPSDASTSELRGLFVRPQQVLYVVDAVGSDL